MKNSDEPINRVLSGLREVEAPAGLERRVLAAMEERAAARVGWKPMRWAMACAVVEVAVAGAVAGAGALMMRPARVRVEKVAAVAVPKMQPVRAERVQGRNTEILRFAQNDLNRRVMRMAVAAPVATGGFPAPPMPLTESEKLLLRVAHRADATELTPLNAEARARQSAEFDKEFIEFFAVPVTVTEEQQAYPTESDKGEAR